MKIIEGIYWYLTIWIYALSKELLTRILSVVFFPIAMMFQKQIRAHLYGINEALVKERSFEDTLDISDEHFYSKVNKIVFFLWLFLDDSTGRDSYNKDGSVMYSASDNPERYPEWINKLDWYWLKATWWSFIRNNTVNYISWFKTAGWKEPLEYETYWGTYRDDIDKNDNNTYYRPGMYLIRVLHSDGKWYPRFTYIGTIFGRKVGIWQGNSRGSGRFSFSIRA